MPIEADLERSSVLAPGGGCRCARVAGLLKASELFQHSCGYYWCNAPDTGHHTRTYTPPPDGGSSIPSRKVADFAAPNAGVTGPLSTTS